MGIQETQRHLSSISLMSSIVDSFYGDQRSKEWFGRIGTPFPFSSTFPAYNLLTSRHLPPSSLRRITQVLISYYHAFIVLAIGLPNNLTNTC